MLPVPLRTYAAASIAAVLVVGTFGLVDSITSPDLDLLTALDKRLFGTSFGVLVRCGSTSVRVDHCCVPCRLCERRAL
jgi:hypothetical protein